MNWLFVDDSSEDRESFAQALSAGGDISVDAIPGSKARELLACGQLAADGLLMDIDLSNESQIKESGLGLTADIRAAQHRGAIGSFPVVRFSYRARVAQNIGLDTSSDQYFDIKIDKDQLSDPKIKHEVQRKLAGVSDVYATPSLKEGAAAVFNLDADRWGSWGSPAFDEQLKLADRDYAIARLFVQALLEPGIFISEDYLALRLGIDAGSAGWPVLLEALAAFRYTGAAAKYFVRWWARGLEMWWDDVSGDAPLAATPVADRHRILADRFADLAPLTMPRDSPGERPWRACALTLEETGRILPLDPSRAVRFRINASTPEWLDPTYAALGPAIKHREDPRLDQSDLKRLQMFMRKA